MDKTSMNMFGNKAVDLKGAKTVFIKTIGHDKFSFSVVLACMPDGAKLRPMFSGGGG